MSHSPVTTKKDEQAETPTSREQPTDIFRRLEEIERRLANPKKTVEESSKVETATY